MPVDSDRASAKYMGSDRSISDREKVPVFPVAPTSMAGGIASALLPKGATAISAAAKSTHSTAADELSMFNDDASSVNSLDEGTLRNEVNSFGSFGSLATPAASAPASAAEDFAKILQDRKRDKAKESLRKSGGLYYLDFGFQKDLSKSIREMDKKDAIAMGIPVSMSTASVSEDRSEDRGSVKSPEKKKGTSKLLGFAKDLARFGSSSKDSEDGKSKSSKSKSDGDGDVKIEKPKKRKTTLGPEARDKQFRRRNSLSDLDNETLQNIRVAGLDDSIIDIARKARLGEFLGSRIVTRIAPARLRGDSMYKEIPV